MPIFASIKTNVIFRSTMLPTLQTPRLSAQAKQDFERYIETQYTCIVLYCIAS